MPELLETIELDPDRVARWSRLAEDANPLHTDPEFAAATPFGVPIVHGHLLAAIALDALQDADVPGLRGASVRFLAPVRVGATVELRWDEPAGVLRIAERDGPPLVEVRVRPEPEPRLEVGRAAVDEYAAAARDRNSIHMSDDAARASGFDGAIAHGMLTLGWAAARLMERAGATEVRALRARFAAPVPVGDTIRLLVDGGDARRSQARVLREDGTEVLTVEAETGRGEPVDVPELPEDAEVVADLVLRIAEHDAIRFARALGGDGVLTSAERARGAGYPAVPTAPTLAFAAPVLGFLAGDPANVGSAAPEPVFDSQAWTRTDRPVVHAGQEFAFARPILVDERLRARTAIISRDERSSSSGRTLSFTRVRTVFTADDGERIAMSDMNLVVIGDRADPTPREELP